MQDRAPISRPRLAPASVHGLNGRLELEAPKAPTLPGDGESFFGADEQRVVPPGDVLFVQRHENIVEGDGESEQLRGEDGCGRPSSTLVSLACVPSSSRR